MGTTKQVRDPHSECFDTAMAVIEAGFATTDQVQRAEAWRRKQRPQIGKLAMTHGKLTMAQVFDVLGEQAITGKLFGETAVELGFMIKGDLYPLLQVQAEITPTLAEALVTLGMITPEQSTLATQAKTEARPLFETAFVESN